MGIPDYETAKNQMEQILSREEFLIYLREEKGSTSPFMEDLERKIEEFLNSTFPQIEVSQEISQWISYGIVFVPVIILLFIILTFWSKFVRQSTLKKKPDATQEEWTMSVKRHIDEAEKCASSQEYREAIRHLFLALILELDQREWIEAKQWKTNWEYFHEIQQYSMASASLFYQLARVFDEVVYGDHAAAEKDYSAFKRQVLDWIGRDPEKGLISS